MTNIQETNAFASVRALCAAAKNASGLLAATDTELRNTALFAIAEAFRNPGNREKILNANRADLDAAKDNGIPDAMLDRLALTGKRMDGICSAIEQLVSLPDPIGTGDVFTRPNGLVITRKRVPLGTVGIIYEARPNVTADAATMCLKSGNAVVLRGGKEAIRSNTILTELMRGAVRSVGLPADAICLVTDTSRESAEALMSMRGLLDVLIPRGGKNLIRSVADNAKVPVIETGAGNCHVYVDTSADLRMAVRVAVNAKCSRPAVCNAAETMLVHKDIAEKFLPMFRNAVHGKYPLEIRGDERTRVYIPDALPACETDWETEYDDYILAVRVVDSLSDAIAHINRYGTGHSEAILTNDYASARRFQDEVNAAAVYVNASTRFTDGGEFGFGAEIGISTQKLHARGPMGLSALTTEKYLISGMGQIRE